MSSGIAAIRERDVLVVGETIIDIVERSGTQTEYVGGSPANVALTLGRLGIQVRLSRHLERWRADPHGSCANTD